MHLRRLGLLDDDKYNVLIMDGHIFHIYNLPFIDDMFQNNVGVALLESHTMHTTHLIDQYSFKPFKYISMTYLSSGVQTMKVYHCPKLLSLQCSSQFRTWL